MANVKADKLCGKCQQRQSMDNFYVDHTHATGYSRYCKSCNTVRQRAWRHRNQDKAYQRRRNQQLKKYGLTMFTYNNLLTQQHGQCAICGTTDSGHGRSPHLTVDHDHGTGEVRGLLCHGCNAGLGNFRDNPVSLMAAIGYVGR